MALYEHVFLAQPDLARKQVDELAERFGALIAAKGGSVGKTEYWGLRPLAYVIKKNNKAHYTLLNLDAPPDALKEMERQMRLENGILRFLSVAVDEHETGLSAPLRAKEREREEERPRSHSPSSDSDSAPPAPETAQQSDTAEPAVAGPAVAGPAEAGTAEAGTAETEPAKTEPAKTEPAKTEPAEAEPAKTEPAEAGPAEAGPAKPPQRESDT